MIEPDPKPWHRRIWTWMQRNEDTAFAVIMAGVAALFIIGIVSAFTYASSSSDSAGRPPVTTVGRAPAETTGSAGGERPRPPRHDPREDEQLERPR
jgi:hypothetical protein